MNDLLVFTGNCQGQYLAAVFDGLEGCRAIYYGQPYFYVSSFGASLSRSLLGNPFLRELQEAQADRKRVVLIQQADPMMKPDVIGIEPDHIVGYPFLVCNAICPVEFRTTFCLESDPGPKRLLAMDIGTIARSQADAGFPRDVADFCQANLANEPLFNTINHPAGPINAVVTDGILLQLAKFDQRYSGSDLVERVRRHEGINFASALPVEPRVSRELGLNWGDAICELGTLISARSTSKALEDHIPELIERNRERLACNTQYWNAVACISWRRGEIKAWFDANRRLLQLAPGFGPFWFRYQTQLLQRGREMEAAALVDQAREVFGSRYEGAWIMCALCTNLGRHEEALQLALFSLSESNFELRALGAVVCALIRLGRSGEIGHHARAVLHQRPSMGKEIASTVSHFIEKATVLLT